MILQGRVSGSVPLFSGAVLGIMGSEIGMIPSYPTPLVGLAWAGKEPWCCIPVFGK
jgi:hypothetical protein